MQIESFLDIKYMLHTFGHQHKGLCDIIQHFSKIF